jgi:competence protein ComEA
LRRGRFDPGRRGLAVLAILALLGALGGAWYFVAAGASAGASPGPSPSARVDSSSVAARVPPALASGWPTASAASPSPIVVDVVGKVASPGVVQLPAGARIHDAIEAAGGALPGTDLTALDLARRLLDGQEVFVGIPPPSGAATDAGGAVVGGNVAPVGTGDGSPPSGVIDINTATSQQLQALPGVGPVLAQHILDWRNQHGAFTSVAQLQQVAGIGPAKYAALMAHVSV